MADSIKKILIMISVVFSVLIIWATHVEKNSVFEISQGRGIIWAAETEPNFYYRIDNTFYNNDLIGVVYLSPTAETAPVPPGLEKWLKPGETAISAALKTEKPYVEAQFGKVTAEISETVLFKDEKLVYYRPLDEKLFKERGQKQDKVYPGIGFGSGEGAEFGYSGYVERIIYLLPLAYFTLGIAVLSLLSYSYRYFTENRRETEKILQLLGVAKEKIFLYNLRRNAYPAIIAIVISCLATGIFIHFFTRIPILNYQLHLNAKQIFAYPLIILSVTAVTLVISFPAQQSVTALKKILKSRFKLTTLFFLGIISLVVANIFNSIGHFTAFNLSLVSGIILLLTGLPSFTRLILEWKLRKRIRKTQQIQQIQLKLINANKDNLSKVPIFITLIFIVWVCFINFFQLVYEASTDISYQAQPVVQISVPCAPNTPCFADYYTEIKKIIGNETIKVANTFGAEPTEIKTLADALNQTENYLTIQLPASVKNKIPEIYNIKTNDSLLPLVHYTSHTVKFIENNYLNQLNWVIFYLLALLVLVMPIIIFSTWTQARKENQKFSYYKKFTPNPWEVLTLILKRTIFIDANIYAVALGSSLLIIWAAGFITNLIIIQYILQLTLITAFLMILLRIIVTTIEYFANQRNFIGRL